jgi:hypothetical protein
MVVTGDRAFNGQAVGRFAGSLELLVGVVLGFAALHPRLYASGRFAGYSNPLRSNEK